MLPAKTARTRSVGTKLTEEEYRRLESKAAERGLTVGEWVREVLLETGQGAKPPAASPTEQVLLAELIALRTIVLNLVYDLASGEPLTPRTGRRRSSTTRRGSTSSGFTILSAATSS
jgi:hypothetical protein